jgi:hypothetical protein
MGCFGRDARLQILAAASGYRVNTQRLVAMIISTKSSPSAGALTDIMSSMSSPAPLAKLDCPQPLCNEKG